MAKPVRYSEYTRRLVKKHPEEYITNKVALDYIDFYTTLHRLKDSTKKVKIFESKEEYYKFLKTPHNEDDYALFAYRTSPKKFCIHNIVSRGMQFIISDFDEDLLLKALEGSFVDRL